MITASLITQDRLLHAATADLIDELTGGKQGKALVAALAGDIHKLKRAQWKDIEDLTPEAHLTERGKIAVIAELIRRLTVAPPRRMLATHENIAMLLQPYASEMHEYVFVITLDSQLPVPGILNLHRISEGTRNGAVIEPVQIFEPALRDEATEIVIAHTHPNDTAIQTMADIVVTQELLALAERMHVKIKDHIIVSRQGSFSMQLNGAWLTP